MSLDFSDFPLFQATSEAWLRYSVELLVLAGLAEFLSRKGTQRLTPGTHGLLWRLVVLRSLMLPGFQGLRVVNAEALPSSEGIAAAPSLALSPWFLGLWLVGSVLLLVRDLRSRHPQGRPASLREAQQLRVLEECFGRTDLVSRAWIGTDPRLESPAVIGPLWKPKLWLPESWLSAQRTGDLRRAVAHEIAHLDRHDLLRVRLVSLWRAALWWHPAVHWTAHRLEVLREVMCDHRAALRLGEEPARYGAWLAGLALEPRGAEPAAALGGGALLVRRIEYVMHGPAWTPRGVRRAIAEAAGLLLLVGLALPPRVLEAEPPALAAERSPGCLELRYAVLAELARVQETVSSGDPLSLSAASESAPPSHSPK